MTLLLENRKMMKKDMKKRLNYDTSHSSDTSKSTISFKVNAEKAIEVILWFCSQNTNNKVNIYNVLKSIFYAEIDHLNKYGRPIIGDNYMAMDYGTVPSLTYDLIKGNKLALSKHKIKELPFSSDGNYITGTREYNTEHFSKSDLKCLSDAYKLYGKLSFSKLKDVNHEHPAWLETRKRSPDSCIPFDLLIEDNQELITELKQYSKNLVV